MSFVSVVFGSFAWTKLLDSAMEVTEREVDLQTAFKSTDIG